MNTSFVFGAFFGAAVATVALAVTGNASITLPRPTVELMVCALDLAAAGYARPARAARYHFEDDDLRPSVILELKRLAADGEAPSKSRWDQQRSADLPSAQHVCRILAVSWLRAVGIWDDSTVPYTLYAVLADRDGNTLAGESSYGSDSLQEALAALLADVRQIVSEEQA